MKITGTLINYYFHCKRKCYLFSNRINLEDNSEDVRIGKVLHEIKNLDKNNDTEIRLDGISIDKITSKYVVELKKSASDVSAARMQLLFYLKKLEERGIKKEGKLIFFQKSNSQIENILKLDEELKIQLDNCINQIENLLKLDKPPEPKLIKGCKMCAYYDYCYL